MWAWSRVKVWVGLKEGPKNVLSKTLGCHGGLRLGQVQNQSSGQTPVFSGLLFYFVCMGNLCGCVCVLHMPALVLLKARKGC